MLSAEEVLRRYADESLPSYMFAEELSIHMRGTGGDTPLHTACIRGLPEEVQAFLAAGADVNAIGDMGYTPLHCAMHHNKPAIIHLLLDHGADPSIRSEFGHSYLDPEPWSKGSSPEGATGNSQG